MSPARRRRAAPTVSPRGLVTTLYTWRPSAVAVSRAPVGVRWPRVAAVVYDCTICPFICSMSPLDFGNIGPVGLVGQSGGTSRAPDGLGADPRDPALGAGAPAGSPHLVNTKGALGANLAL